MIHLEGRIGIDDVDQTVVDELLDAEARLLAAIA
ncbi:hypothetical protein PMI11_06618 [Rhizobium sp. CF142]|nr:hypothetical protein PMI11_06618 [Rhizobium sp. CF142]